jgi:C4-dicarboxylate-specific signal transduction histidine kinase
MSAERPDAHAVEVARLEVERRLARGAAHAVNNSLTAILGEASLLEDAHKRLADVAEACDAIKSEVERCGRIWRSVLAPRPSANHPAGRVDLVRLVADIALLLQRTLGRRCEIETRLPDDAPFGAADPLVVETLLFTLVYHAVDLHAGPLHTRLEVNAVAGGVEAALVLEGGGFSGGSPASFLDPERAANPATRTALATLPAALRNAGGAVEASAAADRFRVAVRLPGA